MHRSASIALLVAFALAGCGSDSGTSKQDFVRKADSICAEAEKQTQAIGSDTPLPDVIDQTRAIVSRSLADLRALDRPSEDGEQLDIFLGLLDQELALF